MPALGSNRHSISHVSASQKTLNPEQASGPSEPAAPSRYYTLGELNALQNFEELYYSTGPAADADAQSAPLLRRLESGRFHEDQIGATLRQSQPEHPSGLLSHRSGEAD